MTPEFEYDVFLSHSAKDKAVVRPLADRLRTDRLKVWFDEWLLEPRDSIPAKMDDGPEHSRAPVPPTSAGAFGSEWARPESHTFPFRDPPNKERRFIPLLLDRAPTRASPAQFLCIDWRTTDRHKEPYSTPSVLTAQRQMLVPAQEEHHG